QHDILSAFAFFLTHPMRSELHTLSLHDALPILMEGCMFEFDLKACKFLIVKNTGEGATGHNTEKQILEKLGGFITDTIAEKNSRSEEHTSELQSRFDLVCRLLLEKKKRNLLSFI